MQPYGALKLFFRRPEGVHRASGKPRASIGMRQFCHENFPCGGLTRRLRRGSGTCRPMGRSHFSFDGERKVCKRKPAARHYGKKAFIAHFDGGARNVARNFVGELPPTFARAPVLPFFRRQNGRAFFPALPNAARLPRRWRGAYSKGCQLGYCIAACAFSQHRKRDLILSIDFLQRKRPAGFYIHAGLYCEP